MSGATGAANGGAGRLERLGWGVAAAVLVALAVPWFLWRDATVVAGLPLWLWWHVGWMALASVVFYAFTRRAWGIGVVPASDKRGETARATDAEDEEVTRRG